jgi:hypothetical protein
MAFFGLLPDKEIDEGVREVGGVCVNRQCGRAATRTVNGVPVCSSCNVYNGKQDSGRPYTIVSRY